MENKVTETKKLNRLPVKGYVGGVCQGLGEYTGIPSILWRILTVATLSFGSSLVYLLLWIFLKKGNES